MAIFTSIGSFIASAAVTYFGASVATATAIGLGAANLTRALAVNAFLNAISPRPSAPKQETQANINQGAAARTRLYGRGLLGGTRAFWETFDDYLYQLLIINHGELDGLISYWIDGRAVTESGGYVTDAQYTVSPPSGEPSWVRALFRDGSANGGDFPALYTVFPTIWTTSHLLQGQATFYIRLRQPSPEAFQKMFPRQHQTLVQAEVRGALVYDPRTATTAYSDNAALVILDYLTNADAMGFNLSDIDLPSFEWFADLSDEDVTLRAGGTEKRYRLWGTHTLQEPHKNVLARMLIGCAAKLYVTAEGKIGIMGGRYADPDVTITDADIYSLEVVQSPGALDSFNVLNGVYTSPMHGYVDTSAQAWTDDAALLTQAERAEEMIADMVPSHGQMRRLMKNEFNRRNRRWTGRIVTNLVGIKARFPADYVAGRGYHIIHLAAEGYDEPVEVMSHAIVADPGEAGAILWKCVMDVASVDDWLAWDAVAEEGVAPVTADLLDYVGTPIPTIALLEQFTSGSDYGIAVEVADLGRADLVLEARIRRVGFTAWSAMTVQGLRAESIGRVLGNNYEVQVRFAGGEWSASSTIMIV
ncbi:MAG: hypothetical protein U5N55_11635 [Cypionkella sp.]|nr:hypothetical protein [Cypionkella sp.]